MPEPVEAPVTPGASETSSSIPSGADGGAVATDEQILGIPDVGDLSQLDAELPQEEEIVEEQPGEGTQPQADALDPSTTPEWLKPWLKDQANGPNLQRLWNQYQNFASLGTPAQVREVVQLFPGGIEEAKSIVAKALETDETDSKFFSGDPNGQRDVMSGMYQDDPQAVASALDVTLDVIRQGNPQHFQEVGNNLLKSLLTESVFLNGAANAVQEKNGEVALQVLEAMVNFAGGNKNRQPSAQEQMVSRRMQELDRKEQEFNQRNLASTSESADKIVRGTMEKEIASTVDKALAKVPDITRSMIKRHIDEEIQKRVREDRNLSTSIQRIVRPNQSSWNTGPQAAQQVANLILGRAKTLIPTVTKEIVTAWTKGVVSANQEKQQKIQSAAQRKDIAGGAIPGSGGRKAISQEEANKMSFDDILNSERPGMRRK